MTELAHAKLSASGSARWLNCAASIRMEEGYPDTRSIFSDEGTVAHHLAEICLREDSQASEYLNVMFDGLPPIAVDEEMVDAVQLYLDYVRGLPGELLIEQRVDFSPWVPDGFGTSDAIVMHEGVATVVDLKYGKGVRVDAENNTQAMLYALGVLNEYDFIYGCDLFRIVIVQPRLDHISEWEITRADLLKWAEEIVKPKAKLTLKGNAPFNPGEKQCQFCKAKAECTALAEYALQTAAEGFEAIDKPITVKDLSKLDNDDIAEILPQLNLITGWVKALEAHALHELERGQKIPGYKLVAGRSLRKWRDEEDAEKALRSSKLKVGEIFTKKLVTPAQAEKLLGKKHPLLEEQVIKPNGKPAIAPESDKRPAIEIDPTDGFDEVA